MNMKPFLLSKCRYYVLTLLFLIPCATAFGQIKVTGKVTDAKGQPLPVVTILEKGTKNVAMTIDDGSFELNNVSKTATLQLSLIGFKTMEIAVEGRSILNIVMEEDAVKLDEVVVTALGISRQKKALGYAVQDVKGDELVKVRTGNVVSSLSGRAAGVQIISSSQLGGGAKINIRGNTSLTGNNQPLFVVDGIPLSNSDFSDPYAALGHGGYDYGNMAADINPDDIESMSLLKGASATALYGSKAANGVVMITTKKAKQGESNKSWGVSVNSSITLDQAAYFPKLQKLYGGGNTFTAADGGVDGFLTADINGKKYKIADYSTDESWGPRYNPDLKYLPWNAFDKWDAANYLVEKPWVYPDNDYTYFFKTGVSLQNNIQISKANEDGSMRISYTNNKSTGIIHESTLTKHTVSFSGTRNFNKIIDAWATANYVDQYTKGRPENGYGDRNPVMKMWQWTHTQLDYKDMESYLNPDGSQRSWNRTSWDDGTPAYADNPYWTINKNYEDDKKYRLYGNFGLNIKFTDWLKLTGRLGIDWYTFTMEERFAIGSQAESQYYIDKREVQDITKELFLTFNKRFSDEKFGVSAILGLSSSSNSYGRTGGVTLDGLIIPDLYVLSNSKTNARAYDYKSEKQINSIYSNITLDYDQFIYADITGRNDWSSTLPADNRSYFYPSFNLSVVLTSIEGLNDISWLNFAKVRGGWAAVGNDTNPYNLISYYNATSGGAFDGFTRYNPPTTMANPELKPERTHSWEVGLEAKFFDNRIGLDLSYYQKRTFDQIVPAMISGSTGYLSKYINSGEMLNKGFEVQLNVEPIRTKDLVWNMQFNIATLSNTVESIADGLDFLNFGALFGVKIGAFAGSSYPVIYGTGYVVDDEGNRMILPSGKYAASPVKAIGNVTPNFTAGMTQSLSYKGFDLSVLIDMQRGGNMAYTSYMFGMSSGMLEESAANDIREKGIILDGVYGKWDDVEHKVIYTDATGKPSATPVKNTTLLSGIDYAKSFRSANVNEMNVFSTDFIKLREVRLGYTIPNKYTGPIKQLRISAYGRNLAIWGAATKHFDPEYLQMAGSNAQGLEGGYLPSTRSYGFSLSFNF